MRSGRVIWGAPTFDQVRVGWEETRRAAAGVAVFKLSTMTATFPSGATILYRSLDNPDNVRGHTADGVVIDEAPFVNQAAWYEVLRPMLIDTGGWAWLMGTPNGRNWFWQEHTMAGDRPDSRAWQAPTLGVRITADGLIREPHPLENPFIPFAEIEQLYRTMPERAFRQEILAEFIEDGGGVFRRVREAATARPLAQPEPGHTYVGGIDWARSHDFTVLSVMDAGTKRQVALDRFNQIGYEVQLGRFRAMHERFGVSAWVAEENSMGGPLIERLQSEGYPVQAFKTTNATKAQVIDALALAFERGEITILDDPVQVAELQAYEMERLPSGLIRYRAPENMHDDTVMALALNWYGVSNPAELTETANPFYG